MPINPARVEATGPDVIVNDRDIPVRNYLITRQADLNDVVRRPRAETVPRTESAIMAGFILKLCGEGANLLRTVATRITFQASRFLGLAKEVQRGDHAE